MLCSVALVRTDVSEESSAYNITVTRIGEVVTLAVNYDSLLYAPRYIWRRGPVS
jgi:hypothetical protein